VLASTEVSRVTPPLLSAIQLQFTLVVLSTQPDLFSALSPPNFQIYLCLLNSATDGRSEDWQAG